jgi:DeoR/GlpR family transcriptional regulator of sugar metabolism
MTERLIPAERRKLILELLQSQGSVHVTELSARLAVTEVTIRRDLEALEAERLLERTHGGAVISRRMRVEPGYSQKHQLRMEEKRAIGRAAAALVEPGETIFIHSGSTNLQIFPYLAGKNVRIITSNAGVVELAGALDPDLIVVGGIYRKQSNSFVGPPAVHCIQEFYASKCFIGVDGVSCQYGLTTPSLDEAEIARTMMAHTHGKVVVVADHSKIGQVADCVTAPIQAADLLVVDGGFIEEYRQELEDLGLQILIAPS